MIRGIRSLARRAGLGRSPALPFDIPTSDGETIRAVAPFTMTSPERVHALLNAVRYVVRCRIPGAVVECGVWRGGSMMAAARELVQLGATDRDLYLYDTFEGMSAPTDLDRKWNGVVAAHKFAAVATETGSDWCRSPIDEVVANMRSTTFPSERLHFIKGKVEDTIPGPATPETIAILRLDTDFYESTRHELEHLFPRLSPGGVLIIDDYGEWEGARRAVDEFVARPDVQLLLNRIDTTGRIAVKP